MKAQSETAFDGVFDSAILNDLMVPSYKGTACDCRASLTGMTPAYKYYRYVIYFEFQISLLCHQENREYLLLHRVYIPIYFCRLKPFP